MPWQIVTVDLIGELPESNGYNAICVIVDRFSKQMHAIPTTTKLSAEGMAKIYRDHVFRLHGLPRKIIHDRGTQFDAKMMKELYKLLHIEGNPSTAYHPQTDGQTERVNQEIEQYLRLYVNHRQSDWADWLSLAEFAYNNREHVSTKLSPFFVNTGIHPMSMDNIRTSSSNLSAEDFAKHIKQIHEMTQENLTKAAADMKRFYDRHAGQEIEFNPGDKVFLDGRNISTDRPTKKMDDKWFGPFEVQEKVGASAYRLKLPRTWKKVHPVFNIIALKPAHEPVFDSQRAPPPPPPVLVDNNEEYEVEEIIDSRFHRNKLQFLVKWVGYQDPTWQPETDVVGNADEAIETFYRLHPGAPRRLDVPSRHLRPIFANTEPDISNGWSGRPTLKGG